MRRFKAIPGKGIVANTYIKSNYDFSQLDDLIDGMCATCYDNHEFTPDCVLEHVEMFISELDVDGDQNYIEFLDAVGTDALKDYVYKFCRNWNY